MQKSYKFNDLFLSKNPDDLLKFYNNFKNKKDLINWSRKRPRGRAKVYEIAGDKKTIIVIPTPDINGEMAKRDKKIFKGFHIIFVSSEGIDPFFNYSHNANAGIKRALKYNPKWIIISNDDISKIDELSVLKNELGHVNEKSTGMVITEYLNTFVCKPTALSKFRYWLRLILHGKTYGYALLKRLSYYDKYWRLFKPLSVDYMTVRDRPINRLSFKKIRSFLGTGYFTILSANFAKRFNGKVFDEIFINGYEDIDLSLRFKPSEIAKINFRIAPYKSGGNSLGKGIVRDLRDFFGIVYFDEKFKKGKYN